MTNIMGFEFPTPNVTGLLSQSWIYIFVICLVTLIAIAILVVVLFFFTYNLKVEVYENIGGGSKMVRTLRTRARKVKVGAGGEELLHLLRPRVYRTAYGRKIAPNTYAFGVGPDGYWYNMTFGDLDTQLGVLDVEPIDRDVRLMQVAVEKIIQENYNPNKNVLIGMSIFLAIMTIIWIVGGYVVVSKIGKTSGDLGHVADKFQQVADVQASTTSILINANLNQNNQLNTPSGLEPVGT